MARSFNGVGDRIDWPSQFNFDGQPFTFACWVYSDANQENYDRILNGSLVASSSLSLMFDDVTQNALYCWFETTGDDMWRSCTTGMANGAWTHVLWHGDGSLTFANHHVYINGVESGYNAGNSQNGTGNITANDEWMLGGRGEDDARNFVGDLAEAAMWNREPIAGEIAALAKGYSPRFFMNGLVWAPDLIRGVNDPISGSPPNTIDGTIVAPHPRIMYPAGPYIITAPAAPPLGVAPTGALYGPLVGPFGGPIGPMGGRL